jgi:hypothetical protein
MRCLLSLLIVATVATSGFAKPLVKPPIRSAAPSVVAAEAA